MVLDFKHQVCPIIYDHTKNTSTQNLHNANTIHANLQLIVHMKLMPLSTGKFPPQNQQDFEIGVYRKPPLIIITPMNEN